jgi:uncharacterized SAM-binding protein YcdF (DUF218 family)
MSQQPSNPEIPGVAKRSRCSGLVEGILFGAVGGLCLDTMDLGAGFLRFHHLLPVCCVAGGLLGLTRARKLVRGCAAMALLALLAISYSPLPKILIEQILVQGAPAPADAVVVLGGGYVNGSTLAIQEQDRLLQGMYLLKAGYANRLVLTRPGGFAQDSPEIAQREMQQLGMNFAVDVVGPVRNTHDEALALAKLVREKGWKRVLLVTHSWHMRRAAAVFEKAGVDVIPSACAESSYDLRTLRSPGDRLRAFRDWLHEVIGYRVYQARGWI